MSMPLKSLLICALSLLLPLAALAEQDRATHVSGDLNWSIQSSWSIPARPLAMAQSLDNKRVFILGANSKIYIFTPEGKQLGALQADPGVTDIDIAARGETLYLINGKDKTYSAIDISFTQQIDITGAPIRGKENAPVTLVVFSDFECPWCGKLEEPLAEILVKNPETVRLVFKHLPLPVHPQAESAARAAIAAQKQGKFWEMHDALFHVANWTPGVIDETAQRIGLDMEQFKQDMDSQATTLQLDKDRNDAQNADVTATPSVFVNGRPAKDRTLAGLQRMVDEALSPGRAK
ncbi:MAG: thioredoxin domain-containing protein [Desulfobulbus sp.]|jgi:predicted DsbA family dithiol-disulfide isomerase